MIGEDIIECWQKQIKTRRCPQCGHVTLQIEPGKGRIHCTHCDFTEDFPVMGEQ